MNKMFLSSYFFISFLFITASFSQDIRLIGDIDLERFPEIGFKVNISYPERLNHEDFKLYESGKLKDFNLKILQDSIEDQSKAILILFEDMLHPDHGFQRETFKYIIKNSLPFFLDKNDVVNIAFFDRNRDGKTPLRFGLNTYTNNYRAILKVLNDYNKEKDRYNNQKSSDLYNAINDGITDLKEEFPNKNKVIIVFSGGKNLELSNFNSISDIANYAKDERVGIYSMQYMVYEHENIDLLSQRTFGKSFHIQGTYPLSGNHSKETAVDSLVNFMRQASQRLHGRNYEITYLSDFEKDGKIHSIDLTARNESLNIPIKVPNCDILCHIKKYPYRYGASFLFMTFLLIFFLYKKKKNKEKRKKIEQEKQRQLLKQIEEQKTITEKLKKDAKRREEEQKRLKELEEQKKIEKERQDIIDEMKLLGFPKLTIINEDGIKNYVIDQPEITIGRKSNNTIQVNCKYMSSKHLKIFYKNKMYYLKDLNSTNGTFLNNKKVVFNSLKSGDVIQIGKTKLTFNK